MATPNPVVTRLADGKALKVVWTLTTADHTGAFAGNLLDYPHRTVYFLGTWGGATAILEGGDGTTGVGLTDQAGNAVSKTADGIDPVAEVPEFIRPRLSVVGAGATVVCTVICRK